MNNFKKNKYLIVKKVIDLKTAKFMVDYLNLKKDVAKTMRDINYKDPHQILGTFTDTQIPNTFSIYSDVANEVLLKNLIPLMEKKTKLKLVPTYSYARVYKKGDELKRHKDRDSCEISTTLNLGGDLWSIYLEPSGKHNMKGIKVNLKPGDMLIYKGCDLEHWRKKFKGKECVQVFLHYNQYKNKKNIYDSRPHLGLPNFFKK